MFDSALQDVSFEPCADDTRSALSKAPSVKSMYGLYDVYSSIDCCYSGRHCSLPATDWHGLLPGNTDSLSNDDFLNQMVKRRSEIDEIRTVLNELTCKATNKWMTVERLSDKSPCVEDRTIRLRQEVIQHEK